MARARAEDADIRAWEIQPAENPRHFAIFQTFLRVRSLRAAWCLATGENERTARAPGHIQRAAVRFRWQERKDAFLKWQAEEEAALLREKRLEARRRRVAQLDRAGVVVSERLEKMDLHKTPAARVLEVLVKLHAAEREELGDTGAEDRPTGSLPALDDVIKPLE